MFRNIIKIKLCYLCREMRFSISCVQSQLKSEIHCYKNIYPWENFDDFAQYLTSCVIYNKDGLIALNKPFGIKIHGHDKPGTRSKGKQRFLIPSIPECDYTIEDALPHLQNYLNVPNLSIVKSAERYSSGIVLLCANENVRKDIRNSFNTSKLNKNPFLTHWILTHGYPLVTSKTEKVGIKFLETDDIDFKQPVIIKKYSKRDLKRQAVTSVIVDYKVLSINKKLPSSLVELSSSSVKNHFVRVYTSTHIGSMFGDIMYSSRMNTVLGIPVKMHLQHAQAYDMQPLPNKITEVLKLPKGNTTHYHIPTMLHLKRILLQSFRGEDVIIDSELPMHFKWTAERLNLV